MNDDCGADPFENGYELSYVEKLYRNRIAILFERIGHLESSLEQRDKFIVSKDMWSEFVATLPEGKSQ